MACTCYSFWSLLLWLGWLGRLSEEIQRSQSSGSLLACPVYLAASIAWLANAQVCQHSRQRRAHWSLRVMKGVSQKVSVAWGAAALPPNAWRKSAHDPWAPRSYRLCLPVYSTKVSRWRRHRMPHFTPQTRNWDSFSPNIKRRTILYVNFFFKWEYSVKMYYYRLKIYSPSQEASSRR